MGDRPSGYIAESYRAAQGNFCMVPGCGESLGAQSHHIQPLSAGGEDAWTNLIVLCGHHHRKFRLHRDWPLWQLTLLTWKFFYESEGKCEGKPLNACFAPAPLPEEIASIFIAGPPAESKPTEKPSTTKLRTLSQSPRRTSPPPQKPSIACEACATSFIPKSRDHRFCSKICRLQAYFKTNPVEAARWRAALISALRTTRTAIDAVLKQFGENC